jgi:hypothetical protein
VFRYGEEARLRLLEVVHLLRPGLATGGCLTAFLARFPLDDCSRLFVVFWFPQIANTLITTRGLSLTHHTAPIRLQSTYIDLLLHMLEQSPSPERPSASPLVALRSYRQEAAISSFSSNLPSTTRARLSMEACSQAFELRVRLHRGRTVLSSLLYLAGALLFLCGSIVNLRLLSSLRYSTGSRLFLIGCSAFLLAAGLDVVDVYSQYRHQVTVPEMCACPFNTTTNGGPRNHHVHVLAPFMVFFLGATTLFCGAITFLPELNLSASYGTFFFLAGNLIYILGSVWSLCILYYKPASISKRTKALLICTKIDYILGATLFIAGGQLSLWGAETATTGSILWIVGSLCFVAGATIGMHLTYGGLLMRRRLSSSAWPIRLCWER